jgi:hypothetical protein
MRDHVGREYVLVRQNRDPAGDRKPETRHLKGRDCRTVIFDSEFDGTSIVEVA